MLEEFGPRFEHVEGEANQVADTLSRHPMEPVPSEELETEEPNTPLQYASESTFVTSTDLREEKFPMSPKLIAKQQKKDKQLHSLMKSNTDYGFKKVEGHEIIHYKDKICVPQSLQSRIIAWYHEYLVHPGATRLENTLRIPFHWKGMQPQIQAFTKTCHKCQVSKKQRKKYGKLPPKQAEVTPWKRVNVDLIGPYNITPTNSSKKYEFRAMTMIDPVTCWFEMAPILTPSSETTQTVFDSCWLARYPRPQEVGFDNGSEFKWLFRELCENYGLKPKPTTDYNPQANAILERMHQVVGNCLRTFEVSSEEILTKGAAAYEPVITATAYAIRSTYHTTLRATPAQLVFGRDMILPIKFKANWALIQQRKQAEINRSNAKENKNRLAHQYNVKDKVLLTKPGIVPKMNDPRTGPFDITKVFDNGTVEIQKGPSVTQTVNIRRLTPYFESTEPLGSG